MRARAGVSRIAVPPSHAYTRAAHRYIVRAFSLAQLVMEALDVRGRRNAAGLAVRVAPPMPRPAQ